MPHSARRQLIENETLKSLQISGNTFQYKVALAGEHVGLSDEGPAKDPVLEGMEIRFRLIVKPDHGEGRQSVAQPDFVDQRGIACDETGFFERPDAAQRGRSRKADTIG